MLCDSAELKQAELMKVLCEACCKVACFMSYAQPKGRACKVSLVVEQDSALQQEWLQTQPSPGMTSSQSLNACQTHHLFSRHYLSPCIVLWAKHHAQQSCSCALDAARRRGTWTQPSRNTKGICLRRTSCSSLCKLPLHCTTLIARYVPPSKGSSKQLLFGSP